MVWFVLLWSQPTQAQSAPSASPLEVSLEIETSTALLGEPVYATVRLTNRGREPVMVPRFLDPQLGNLQINVSSQERARFIFVPLFVSDPVQAKRKLNPGEEIAASFPIFYGALGWTFPKSDTYHISAVLRNSAQLPGKRAQSRPMRLTVADDNTGATLMGHTRAAEEAAKFLLWQRGDHLQDGQALLSDFMKRYPDSLLTDYIRVALGHNFSRDFRNYAVGRIRPADCEAALAYLRPVHTERLPALLQVQQRLDEARCLVKQSKTTEAVETMRQAHHVAEGRPEMQLLFQQAARLEPTLSRLP